MVPPTSANHPVAVRQMRTSPMQASDSYRALGGDRFGGEYKTRTIDMCSATECPFPGVHNMWLAYLYKCMDDDEWRGVSPFFFDSTQQSILLWYLCSIPIAS